MAKAARFLPIAFATLALAAGTPTHGQEENTVVRTFQQMCLSSAETVQERAAIIGQVEGFETVDFTHDGALHDADTKLAWRGEIDGVAYYALLSQRGKSKSFSTLCELRAQPYKPASVFAAAFEAAVRRVGLNNGERLDPVFYQFSGRLESGKRAHAKLTSAPVRRGMAMVGSRYLSFSIIY